FVNTAGHIIGITFNYFSNPIQSTIQQLSTIAEWRSAAISKDGRFVAGLTSVREPYIYIFDLLSGESEAFQLYNPTYTTGQSTGDVQFADVLEFDYSGTNLMYDAFNELTNSQGEDISYWDIGFLEFWDNSGFADPNEAFISKLFSGLPDKTGVGDPSFSKNSPFIIAFDLIDETSATTRYDIYGANTETGDYGIILSNNGTLGWPNYNRLDTKLIYEVQPTANVYNIRQQGLNSNKIQPSGGSTSFISNHSWGVWYANGNRSLQVGANEVETAEMAVNISPNPVAGSAVLQIKAIEQLDANIQVCNLMGQTLLNKHVELVAGDNQLDLNMAAFPSGNYVVRVLTASGQAAVKVVKE
ncbi:MAG: T9SS type A sorting domain-containing protein, partial [Saprospiraceae bacterium]|nr:T9SS type A sorting domain-containing protein [Saprospiraceae bacterium]